MLCGKSHFLGEKVHSESSRVQDAQKLFLRWILCSNTLFNLFKMILMFYLHRCFLQSKLCG